MPTQVPDFPLPVRMVYEGEGNVRSGLMADMARLGQDAQKQFERSFGEIDRVIQKTMSSFRNNKFSFDIDLSGLRQTTAEATFAVDRLRLLGDAAKKLAVETNDNSTATKQYLAALRAQTSEAERAKSSAYEQLQTYGRLQGAVDRLVERNNALAQSYRDTFREQAISANLATRSQQAVNARFGLDAAGARIRTRTKEESGSARESAAVFASQSYAPKADTRDTMQRFREGAASLDKAAISATTLDQVLGRVAGKGALVAAGLEQAAQAQARATQLAQAADAEAAAARNQLAQATARLEGQLDPVIAAQQRYTQQMDLLDRALAEGIIDMQRYGHAVEGVATSFQAAAVGARQGTTAFGNVINSVGAMRTATLQAGQQLQDIGISLYSGQRAGVVFAQQLPQLAFALSGLEGSANKTHDRIGRFATFLSGPWGLAVGLAIGGAFELIGMLIKMGSESDSTKGKTLSLADAFSKSKYATSEATKAMKEYNAEQERSRENTDSMIKLNLMSAEARLKDAVAIREQIQAELEKIAQSEGNLTALYGPNAAGAAATPSVVSGLANKGRIDELRTSIENLRIEDAVRDAGAAVDPLKAINNQFDDMAEAAKKAATNNLYLSKTITDVLTAIEKRRDAALDAERERQRAEKKDATSVTTAFGSPLQGSYRRTGGFLEQRPGHKHAGIDYAAPTGTPVYAAQAGNVSFASQAGAYGNLIKLLHGAGTETRYGHLSAFNVRQGQAVEKGDLIGRVGSTGRSTGAHLHYEVRVNGKPVDPSKSAFPIDPVKVAQDAQKAEERLADFGARAGESIQRINERFDEQPKLIDQSAQATRTLNDLMKELAEQQPPGFKDMIADAERAKAAVADAVPRIFRDLGRDSQRGMDIAELSSQGRDAEVAALTKIWELEERLGPLTADRKQEVIAIAEAEQQHREALEKTYEVQQAFLDASRSARAEVEAILSGQGKIGNVKNIARQLQGKILAEQLFGDVFRDLDKWVKEKTGIGSSVDKLQEEVDRSATALQKLVDAVTNAADAIGGGGGSSGGVLGASAFGTVAGGAGALATLISGTSIGWNGKANPKGMMSLGGANDNYGEEEIVVVANKPGTVMGMSASDFMEQLSGRLGKGVTDGLNNLTGTSFFSKFSGVLGGALGGYAQGGIPGGILGALGGIKDLPKGIADVLGKGVKGAGTGSAVSGIAGAFGINLSNTGAQIGGAIGGMLPIPGGDIIGAIAGGIIGKLLGKTKTGTATIGQLGSGGGLGITGTGGNNAGMTRAASDSAGGVLSTVERIAQMFGASIDAAMGSVTVGLRNGKWRVDPTGSGTTKTSKGAIDFGKEGASEAIRYATLDLIRDGVIKGLRESTLRILKQGDDLDRAIEKAASFESVFTRLKQFKDPVGAALDALDREFTRLNQIFNEASASVEERAQLEELYELERTKTFEQAKKALTSSLQGLLDDLQIGETGGLSLRKRQANAVAAYDPLRARVAAGDTSAFDDYVEAATALLEIERQLYGSQKGYFDRSNEVQTLTQEAINKVTQVADAAAGRDSPFSDSAAAANDNSGVVSAINSQTATLNETLISQLTATNQNLGTLATIWNAYVASLGVGTPLTGTGGTNF